MKPRSFPFLYAKGLATKNIKFLLALHKEELGMTTEQNWECFSEVLLLLLLGLWNICYITEITLDKSWDLSFFKCVIYRTNFFNDCKGSSWAIANHWKQFSPPSESFQDVKRFHIMHQYKTSLSKWRKTEADPNVGPHHLLNNSE